MDTMLSADNKIVHGLWIGNALSSTELLTIQSFTDNGHEFHLWAYDSLSSVLPQGCILHNANDIIPRENIFKYKYSNQFGHGKGSYAGFSDIFRYKLLYLHGSWWSDMDVTCLKPLDFEDEYVFRTHQSLPLVGNVMKCPKGSKLMQLCFEQASSLVSSENTDWHLPIQILCDNVFLLGLEKYIKDISNPDSWNLIRKLLIRGFDPPAGWYVIHWVNEEWRRNNIPKNKALQSSFFYKLTKKYNVSIRIIKGYPAVKMKWNLSLGTYFNILFN